MPPKKKHLKINEVSKLYGIGLDSLRYYEEIGLLIPQRGEQNHYRYYSHRDLMKLNLIRELRELHFSFKQIQDMLGKRSLATTLEILSREVTHLKQEISKLQYSLDTTRYRIDGIQKALSDINYHEIFIREESERNCLHIASGDISQDEIDYYLIHFIKNGGCSLADTIGRSDGYRLDPSSPAEDGGCATREVFIVNKTFSVPVSFVLPAGNYLTVAYSGGSSQSGIWSKKLFEFASEHHLTLEGDLFEFCIIDYYETDLAAEFLTHIQIKIADQPVQAPTPDT
ncbi:MAG: MerR family transcriptional regulator [Oscillospiraceae bacterium]|nr:MerR family transcriptional regulator [Oscillospiraceae bacterium]